MRTLVDANILLRYMLHDDDSMFKVAEQTICNGAFLLPEVLAEVVYVLLGVYSVPRGELASQLQILTREVQSEHPKVLDTALATFGSTKLDFVDCLLVAYNRQLGDKVVSFDRKVNRLLA
ncbi:MAG: PIN domain-containing protein [Kiritimatiellae bacterium]|nr:PIN domain-containing protein [Kiritimatiellia bacterium]